MLTPSYLQAALVDLDGTLVDTMDDFVAVLRCMLAELPAPYCDFAVERATVEPLVGKGTENLVKSLLALVDTAQAAIHSEAARADGTLTAQALESYYRHYQRINGSLAQVYPGVLQGLEAMRARGMRLACVTNKPTGFAKDLLAIKGLDGFFEITIGGDAVARKKPDPMALLMACEALGTVPTHTLMVGDSSNDAQAARAAGCPVLLVSYGYNHGHAITTVDADAYTDSLAEIPWDRWPAELAA
ncbi:phosphoglycolate phosphatase [Rhodoferax aquaticus]|uniref:Phosphoglycolate phosphatase n=1 Tax=Rhodoferax aquaticus TaxID=2527691 RepID=A0A515EL22_9BURK|nr:phosphoglycolate phosphatase [Rhodoferax aquaticus]QDL53361.1 phosphoglycolate phosphatase [Rhodoferax aquaticus]